MAARPKVLAILLSLTLAATARPARAPAAPGRVDVDTAAVNPRILASLLQQGRDALGAGSFKAARDAFVDALSIDRKNAQALEGAGTAYLRLNDFARAKPLLEQAAESAGGAAPRPLVLNLAAVHVRQKNPMRAVKLARAYLTAHPEPVDEPVLNALGVALFQTDENARKVPLFRDSVKFYEAANAKLEATRPGMKRWGTEWINQREWAARDGRWKSQQAAADQRYAALVARRSELARAQKEVSGATRGLGIRRRSPGEVDFLRRRAADVSAAVEVAQKEYETAVAAVERPKFPAGIEPVPMDAPPVALAVAGPRGLPGGPDAARPPAAEAPAVEAPLAEAPPAPPRRRRVVLYAVAFAVAPDLVVTAASALEKAAEISVQSGDGASWKATVVRTDDKSGLALLRVEGAELKLTPLPLAADFASGAVSCVSFPAVNMFDPIAERVDGGAPAPKEGWTVRLSRHPRLPGGPLLANGKVVGVELASRDSDPARVPAATLDHLRRLLGADVGAKAIPGAGVDPAAAVLQLCATRETAE